MFSNVILIGNPGVGKSYLLNSLGANFTSGFSAVVGLTDRCSYCNVKLGTSTVRLIDVPGLLEATQERIANNARVITEAFRTDGPFKLIFVFAGQSGRVPPSDLFTIGKVMSAVDFAVDVGVIINNVPESQVKLYHDNRKPIVESLNSCANGRIVDGWFTVIPNFPEDNPKGPMPYMTALLTTMTSQDIPRVTPISMETNEFNHFVEFVKRFKEYVRNLWRQFQEWYLPLMKL